MPLPLLPRRVVLCRRQQSCLRGAYRRGKMTTVLAASTALPLRMLGQRGSTFKRRRGAWYAKLESVLAVTGGELYAMAWFMVTGTPISPMPVLTQPQACPRAWGFLQIKLEFAAPGYVIAAQHQRSRKASSSVECKRTAFSLTCAGEPDWGAAIALPLADSPSKRDRGRRATVSGTVRAYNRLSSDCRHRG